MGDILGIKMISERAKNGDATIFAQAWCWTHPPGFPSELPMPLSTPWSSLPTPNPVYTSPPAPQSIPAFSPQAFPPLPAAPVPQPSSQNPNTKKEAATWSSELRLSPRRIPVTAERYMSSYYTERCMKNCPGPVCIFSHGSDSLRRKPARLASGYYLYTNVKCLRSNCHSELCPFSHSSEEFLYHPEQYKTTTCGYPLGTNGICLFFGMHCPFAHDPSEIRTPAPFNCLHPSQGKPGFPTLESQERWARQMFALAEPAKKQGRDQYPTDKFDVSTYKIVECGKPGCRATPCTGFHSSVDKRRNPKVYSYISIPCRHVFDLTKRKFLHPDKCPLGDSCRYSHTKYESYYHPQFYKSQQCHYYQSTGSCKRGTMCAFMHGEKNVGEKTAGEKGTGEVRGGRVVGEGRVVGGRVVGGGVVGGGDLGGNSLGDSSGEALNVLTGLVEKNQQLAMDTGTLKCQVEAMRTSIKSFSERITCPACQTREKSIYLTCGDLLCSECWQNMREDRLGSRCLLCKARANAVGMVRL